jgi:hypothetical protein
VVVPLLFDSACEGVVLGAMGWAGVALNLVLTVLPPLLFVIALATAVHVYVRFRDLLDEGMTPEQAVAATYRDSGWAVFWSGVTTIIGFGSLAGSAARPVHELGIWAGLGIAFLTLLAFLVYPLLLAELATVPHPERAPGGHVAHRAGPRIAAAAMARRGVIVGALVATSALALVALPRLSVETNALEYFSRGNPVRVVAESLDERGIGLATVELVLRRDEGTWRDWSELQDVSRLVEALRAEPSVRGVVSAADLVDEGAREASGSHETPHPRALALAWRALTEGSRAHDFSAFFGAGGRATRVMVFVPQLDADAMDALRARLSEVALRELPSARLEITGQYPLLLRTQRVLLRTLALSLTSTVACLLAIFWVVLRSFPLALLAMVPNTWPVLLVVGGMAFADWPVDIATVMVASVVLGIAVDDTFHTLGHFRRLAPRVGAHEAMRTTLSRTAPAYLLTGAILVAGFGACALSAFAPTRRFGILSAAAVALAVLADLVVVPALFGRLPDRWVGRLSPRGARGETAEAPVAHTE